MLEGWISMYITAQGGGMTYCYPSTGLWLCWMRFLKTGIEDGCVEWVSRVNGRCGAIECFRGAN